MSEPIILHDGAGNTLTVYTRSQADGLLRGGQWYATEADAKAGRTRNEPTPATAARLDALEGDGAAVLTTDDGAEGIAPAPEPEPTPEPPVKTVKRPAKGKGSL